MRGFFSFGTIGLLLLGFAVLLTTCAKEYSYEGGPVQPSTSGTAAYTFLDSAGSCLRSSLNGKYYAGTAPDTGNYVNLQVNVTKSGTYNITTTSANGFRFTASGSFNQTGVQWIKLAANGAPASEGVTDFKTPVGQGCTFSVPVEKAPPVLAGYSFISTGGKCTGPFFQGNYIAARKLDNSNTVDIKVDVKSIGQYTISTDTLDSFYFSAAGSFTSLGAQTVTLTAHGTPDIADSLSFTPTANGITGCSFPMAVTNGEPMATYVIESGIDMCIGLPAGNYAAGQQLTAANAISINVYVTVVGNYTVASQTVNGMRFYSSGTFINTGSQKLTLQAAGKPIAAGDFYFVPKIIGPHPLGGQSCGFNLTVK